MGRSRSSRPRQADIAREAGVSQATVSLVMNGKPEAVGIAPETVRRVREAAERLSYVANPAAVRLVGKRNRLLGVYTFAATFPVDVRDSYYPFLAGVEERAAGRGYDLLMFTASSGAHADALARVRLADGCVLFGREASIAMIERLLDDGFPIVYIGRRDELGDRIPYVGADYARASAEVVRRLAALGHERIAYLREPGDQPSTEDRARGVRAAGVPGVRVRAGGRVDSGWVRAQHAEGVTAFVAETVELHASLTGALADAGLRHPRDVSVAMLGDDVAPAPGAPVVSGFALPRREMGRQAADLLIDMLDERPGQGPRQRLLTCPPVAGETAGPARRAPLEGPE
ncbi:LacI family DNA-binding transcriptional regulator [Spirillospora sp. NPDC029432]|uniref:LacI family DNA-binding transcriptional regulator n=1 Tax=Spirillospora sp. NPDC029432 TaxID=3154599 RepID=UPI0034535828